MTVAPHPHRHAHAHPPADPWTSGLLLGHFSSGLLIRNAPFCFSQEYADGGDLLGVMIKCGRLSERTAVRVVVLPLLRALCHLHSRFLMHRWAPPPRCWQGCAVCRCRSACRARLKAGTCVCLCQLCRLGRQTGRTGPRLAFQA